MGWHGFDFNNVTIIVLMFGVEAYLSLFKGAEVNALISLHFGFFTYQLIFWTTGFAAGRIAPQIGAVIVKRKHESTIPVNMGTNWLFGAVTSALFVGMQLGSTYLIGEIMLKGFGI